MSSVRGSFNKLTFILLILYPVLTYICLQQIAIYSFVYPYAVCFKVEGISLRCSYFFFFFVVHINIQHENEENLDQSAIFCLLFIVISVFTKDNLRDRGLKKKSEIIMIIKNRDIKTI
jgi:hypothetical protein